MCGSILGALLGITAFLYIVRGLPVAAKVYLPLFQALRFAKLIPLPVQTERTYQLVRHLTRISHPLGGPLLFKSA